MLFPESWLRTFVNPSLTTEELAHALTMAGLEVESVRAVAPPTSGIVVGRVLEVVKHPNADKLHVCQVDAGTGEILNIVCGAPNVAVGIKVPVALVGAQLPPAEPGGAPFAIKRSKLRGVESCGMLCSARELKISEDHNGLLVLPDETPVGQDIREALHLDDAVFEIKLTPNKADCLSVFGVAREAAAITGAPLQALAFAPVAVKNDAKLPVRIDAPDLCGRFSGRVIRGVNARAKTPAWMVQRLERSGQRSISALVDISNYVMLELGRPSHVFDLDKIHHGGLHVRWGRVGETLKLLNGNTVTVDEKVGVIADDQCLESLAGIMGGDSSAVTLDTTNIYIESAFWWPDSIRGRSRRYNFATDAGHRFERGVDWATTVEHLERISQLVLDICGGEAGPVDDQTVNVPQRLPVTMRVARAQRIIGVPVSADDIAQIFTRLGLSFERQAGQRGDGSDDVFNVTPPSYRFDIEIEEDLIEEVARIYGFEKIPSCPPIAANEMRATHETQRSLHALRHALAARDYAETISFSFVDAQWEQDFADNIHPVKLLNPIANQFSVMRTTLFGSLIDVLRYNLNRRAERIRVFETGRVFRRDASAPASEMTVAGFAQPRMIGALAYGHALPEQWGAPSRMVDFFDLKGDLEALLAPRVARFVAAAHPALHPGRSARVEVAGRVVGWIGELHPRWLQKYDLPHAPVLFEVEVDALMQRALPAASDVSKFPPVRRDIALVVDQKIEAQVLLDAFCEGMKDDACKIVKKVALFDEFHAKSSSSGLDSHEKSLAFRVTLQDTGSTLEDETVDLAIKTLVARVAGMCGARLRG